MAPVTIETAESHVKATFLLTEELFIVNIQVVIVSRNYPIFYLRLRESCRFAPPEKKW
jgi:hypothetical protein